MRAALLPTLRGYITQGLHLRIATARSISELETYGKRGTSLPPGVPFLEAFFTAGLAACTAIRALPASITVAPTAQTLTSGAPTVTLVITKTPLSGSVAVSANTNFGYSSSNQAIATVSAAGVVTRVAVGTCTITVAAGTKTATVAITCT